MYTPKKVVYIVKKCKQCEIVKDVTEFNKSSNTKDGREGKCRECRNANRKKRVVKCAYCGKDFKTSNKNAKFCSISCNGASRLDRVDVSCSNCGELITLQKSAIKNNNYCSKECLSTHLKERMTGEGNHNYKRVKHNCSGCDQVIEVEPSRLKEQKYIFCSNECYKKNIGNFFKGENNPNYNQVEYECKTCGESFFRIPSANRGKEKYCSKECYFKRYQDRSKTVKLNCPICNKTFERFESSLVGKKRVYCSKSCSDEGFSKFHSGENNALWDFTKTTEERIVSRKYPAYNEWRNSVFNRDDYTCKKCGDSKGGNLVAHHILNYSKHKELRTTLENGITLCETCHKEFHDKNGYTNNDRNQLDIFLREN